MSPILEWACATCALGAPSKLTVMMPLMLTFPYLVALAVYRLARRFSP